jgi:transglutaminase-like putative cysteine protease
MWVWTDHPPPLPEEAQVPVPTSPLQRPYWRGVTYATYTGRGWSNPPLMSKPLAPVLGPQASSALPGNLTQRFDILAPHGDTLFAANQPVSSTTELAVLTTGSDMVGLRGTFSLYTVTSRIVTATQELLQQAPITVTAGMTAYLQLPSALPKRVHDLAVDITVNAPTPYDKAVSIETYLRTYSYTLDLPPFPEGRDLVDYFLFDAPGGYCDYYASAMVVMLRAVGVPARLASGYLTGVYDSKQGAYRVIGANAHSWPEVYFESIGWVEFEPTASQPVLARERGASPIGLSGEQVRAAEVERQQRATLTRNLVLFSGTLVLVLGIIAVFWIHRERQSVALPAETAIPLLYQRLRRRSQWLGVKIRPSDTPDEFVAAFNQAVKRCVATRWQASAAIAQDSAARIGDLYRRASYSPALPGANEARQAWTAWRALSLRAWWFGWWGKIQSLPRISANKRQHKSN